MPNIYEEARDHEMLNFLAGVRGVVEATREEEFGIWERCCGKDSTWQKRTWDRHQPGLMEVIGYLDIRRGPRKFEKLPICISLNRITIDGKVLLFYHATSRVVDRDMVRDWLKASLPKSAFRHNSEYLNHSDATNWCNVLHEIDWQDKQLALLEASKEV